MANRNRFIVAAGIERPGANGYYSNAVFWHDVKVDLVTLRRSLGTPRRYLEISMASERRLTRALAKERIPWKT